MSLDLATLGIAVETKQVKDGEVALDRLAQAGDRAEKSTKALSSATDMLSMAAKAAAGAIAAIKLVDFIRDSTMLAARYETLGVVMKVAGNNAGYTAAQMDAYSKALQQSGISMMQSRNAVTQLATANIDLAKAAQLGRAAQDLAVVGNINSSQALERLIHGIKAGEVDILRGIGLNVDFEASYKRFAQGVGTTSDKLTENQKVTARTTAVIQEAAKYNGIYEESMTTAGKAMTSLTRYVEDFKVKAGEAFLPALATAVFNITDAFKAMNKELEAAGQSGLVDEVGDALNGALKTGLETVAVLGANVAFVFKGIGREIGAIAAQAVAVAKGDFAGAAEIGRMVTADAEAARAALDEFEKKVLSGGESSKKGLKMTEEGRIAAGKAARDQQAADEKAAKAMEDSAKAAKKAADEYQSLMKSIREKQFAAQAELNSERELTEAEKYQVEVESKLAEILRLNPKMNIESAKSIAEQTVETLKANAAKKQFAEIEQKMLDRHADQIDADQKAAQSIREGTDALKLQTEELGLTSDELLKLKLQRIDSQIEEQNQRLSIISLINPLGQQAEAIRDVIAALEDRKRAMQENAAGQRAAEAINRQAEAWRSIEGVAHQTFVSIFDSGKSAFDRLRDTLKNGLYDLLYQMTVKQWIIQIAGSVSGSSTATAAFGQSGSGSFGGGSLVSNGLSTYQNYSALTNAVGYYQAYQAGYGLTAAEANAAAQAYYNAGYYGTGASIQAGNAMGTQLGESGFSVGEGLGYAGAIYSASQGQYGAAIGQAIGTYIMPGIGTLIGGLIGSMADKYFAGGGPKSEMYGGDRNTGWGLAQTAPVSAGMDQLAQGIETEFNKVLATFGKSAQDILIGIGADADPNGKASSRTGYSVTAGGKTTFSEIDVSKLDTATLQANANRALLAALESVDISEPVNKYLDSLGEIGKLTSDQASAALTMVQRLHDVNTAMDKLGFGADALTSSLVSAFGGIDNLQSALDSYYENFYTDAEKRSNTIGQITAALDAAGAAFSESDIAAMTRADFRAWIEGIDQTTDAGKALFAAALQVSSAFASVTQAMENATSSLSSNIAGLQSAWNVMGQTATGSDLASMLSMLENGYSYLTDIGDQADVLGQIGDLQGKVNSTNIDALQKQLDSARSLLDAAKGIKGYLDSLKLSDLSTFSPEQKLAEAASQYSIALAQAKAGDAAAAGNLQGLADSYLGSARDYYGSNTQYASIFDAVTSGLSQFADATIAAKDPLVESLSKRLDALSGIGYDTLTATRDLYSQAASQFQSNLKAITDQVIATDSVKSAVDQLPPALAGILSSSVASSIAPLLAQSAAAQHLAVSADGQSTVAKAIGTGSLLVGASSMALQVESLYESMAGRVADASGLAYWTQRATAEGGISSITDAFRAGLISSGEVPKFAAGGDHFGGLRLVGENGPELEVTGPARIFNARQTQQILAGGAPQPQTFPALEALVRDLVLEVKNLRAEKARADSAKIARADDANRKLSRIESTGILERAR